MRASHQFDSNLKFFVVATAYACAIELLGSRGFAEETDAAAESPKAEYRIDGVVKGLRANEDRIENLTLNAKYVRVLTDPQYRRRPARFERTEVIEISSDGRVRYSGHGGQFNLKWNGNDPIIAQAHWEASFNGVDFRFMHGSEPGAFVRGEIHPRLVWFTGLDPREITTHHKGLPVSQSLQKSGALVVGVELINENKCVVVETAARGRGARFKSKYWIDPDRGYAVVRRADYVQFAPDGVWIEDRYTESADFQEIEPNIWLPRRSKLVAVSAHLPETPLQWSHEGDGYRWQVNKTLDSNHFDFEFPEGCEVHDLRHQGR